MPPLDTGKGQTPLHPICGARADPWRSGLLRARNPHRGLAQKLAALERKYDHHFHVVLQAIKQITQERDRCSREIGFKP